MLLVPVAGFRSSFRVVFTVAETVMPAVDVGTKPSRQTALHWSVKCLFKMYDLKALAQ